MFALNFPEFPEDRQVIGYFELCRHGYIVEHKLTYIKFATYESLFPDEGRRGVDWANEWQMSQRSYGYKSKVEEEPSAWSTTGRWPHKHAVEWSKKKTDEDASCQFATFDEAVCAAIARANSEIERKTQEIANLKEKIDHLSKLKEGN